ncbi:MAG: class I SAM-dependent methyltransferase [Nonlabens sp.]
MNRHPSSYRDPAGFIYSEKEILYRQINPVYFKEYKEITESGIYQKLFEKNWLISHSEVHSDDQSVVLQPELVPFISYPYEWSFTQYKHAAQLTLRIQMFLLEHGFSLKDASAFNVTFHNGKAIFIDTLSIERYKDDTPWRALKQFSEHFFAPLFMAQKFGSRHLKTLQLQINGCDLNEVKNHLSMKDRFNHIVHSHINLLSKTEENLPKSKGTDSIAAIKLSKKEQLNILKVLESHISKMEIKENTEWSTYYSEINYKEDSFKAKKELIQSWVSDLKAKRVVDLGGNDGTFGAVILDQVEDLVVCDIDQSAVDHSYKKFLKNGKVISLVTDLMQPAPAIGFNNEERSSFQDRLKKWSPDMSMALALIHHISLTGNVPFEMSAAFFASLSPYLIIEFPHRNDSWVQFILDSKRDARHLFDFYGVDAFAKAYKNYYTVLKSVKIEGTERTLFLMKRK